MSTTASQATGELEPFYEASPIRRIRSTKAEVEERRGALLDIVSEMRPMTVRQVFYQASVRNLVEKTEAGYRQVQTDLVLLRRTRAMPYGWIADTSRQQRRPYTYDDVADALEDTARTYRKALWRDVPAYVEIWLEKDALSGVVQPITYKYDVPLMVARGYASLSFLHEAASYIQGLEVPAFVYHFGDFDPSGVNAAYKIDETLREMAPNSEIHFERIAVTPEQIEAQNLPTRPTKATDSRSKGFGEVSVELDAMAPGTLRALVEGCINRHMTPQQYRALMVAESSERDLISRLVADIEV